MQGNTRRDAVRQTIFMDAERLAMQKFLKDRKKNEIVRVTRYRADKYLGVLRSDVALLEQLVRAYPPRRVRKPT